MRIEFPYDHVSKPAEPRAYRSWDNCGYHDRLCYCAPGQQTYHSEINDILKLLDSGWELSEAGEVLRRVSSEVADLLGRESPAVAGSTAQQRVGEATQKFHSRSSNGADRRDAVRGLADVLKLLRPQLMQVPRKGTTA